MTKTYCDLCGAEILNPNRDGSKLSHTKKWETNTAWENPLFFWSDICIPCSDDLQSVLGKFERSRAR